MATFTVSCPTCGGPLPGTRKGIVKCNACGRTIRVETTETEYVQPKSPLVTKRLKAFAAPYRDLLFVRAFFVLLALMSIGLYVLHRHQEKIDRQAAEERLQKRGDPSKDRLKMRFALSSSSVVVAPSGSGQSGRLRSMTSVPYADLTAFAHTISQRVTLSQCMPSLTGKNLEEQRARLMISVSQTGHPNPHTKSVRMVFFQVPTSYQYTLQGEPVSMKVVRDTISRAQLCLERDFREQAAQWPTLGEGQIDFFFKGFHSLEFIRANTS